MTLLLAKLVAKAALRTILYAPTVAPLVIYVVPIITNFIKLGAFPIIAT